MKRYATINIGISPELLNRLKKRAARLGVAHGDIVRTAIARECASPLGVMPDTKKQGHTEPSAERVG